MKTVTVPARRWYDNEERVLTFPDRWDVDHLTAPGLEKPCLTPSQIRVKIENPIDGPALSELACGKRQAVIVFDDMTRPTPIQEAARVVLDALHKAGMGKEQIRFIWGLGAHGAYDLINARKKLGDDIVENYRVFNHDAFQGHHLTYVDRTPDGVDLWFNREFMRCDLKIAIGCVTPHVQAGFGGGAKIIMPGVAGIETINQFHKQLARNPASFGLGKFEKNILRREIDYAGDAVNLSFKIDCLINRKGEIADLFAGSFRATHMAGAEAGKEHYGINSVTGYDIVVSNGYAKASESGICTLLAMNAVKQGVGSCVIIMDAPEGQATHYVFRRWGEGCGGTQYHHHRPGTRFVPHVMKRFIIFNPAPDPNCIDVVCHNDDAVFVKTWEEVLAILQEEYPGPARVAVIPDGTMQFMRIS
jgi:nickel-dependent lactate racemase